MMKDLRFVVASGNKAKIKEIKIIASNYPISVVSPEEVGIPDINVVESSDTYQKNAELKLKAYLEYVNDKNLWVIADDSGIEIPALNNEPGVQTRTWIGRTMTDKEILNYCLRRMSSLKGDDRRAVFRTILAVGRIGMPIEFYTGELQGKILEKPRISARKMAGFPFRSVFYVTSAKKMIYELESVGSKNKQRIKTHRELAFENLFKSIKKN